MTGMYTLDTNVLIYYAEGDPEASVFLLRQLERRANLFLPTIAVVEFFAFPKFSDRDRARFEELVGELKIIPLSLRLALHAGKIRRLHGLKLGDAVIAATALATHSPLATRNVRDFKKVAGLEIIPV